MAREQGSDFHTVEEGYLSVTPIHADMLSREAMQMTGSAFATLSKAFGERWS